MISFIKNLISGIVNFFTGLFKKKKDSSFYLELKEEGEENNLISKATKAAESVTATAQKAVESATDTAQQAVESAKSTTKKAVKAAQESVPAGSNGKKDTKEANIIKPSEVELVQTAKGVKAQKVQKEKTLTPSATQSQPKKETTFAPEYLTPTNSNGRRRPGANMTSFLDMAREVKAPNR
jgi:hypothetical protein